MKKIYIFNGLNDRSTPKKHSRLFLQLQASETVANECRGARHMHLNYFYRERPRVPELLRLLRGPFTAFFLDLHVTCGEKNPNRLINNLNAFYHMGLERSWQGLRPGRFLAVSRWPSLVFVFDFLEIDTDLRCAFDFHWRSQTTWNFNTNQLAAGTFAKADEWYVSGWIDLFCLDARFWAGSRISMFNIIYPLCGRFFL